jgi:hypothetical protein
MGHGAWSMGDGRKEKGERRKEKGTKFQREAAWAKQFSGGVESREFGIKTDDLRSLINYILNAYNLFFVCNNLFVCQITIITHR